MIQTILEVLGAVVAALLASGGYWNYKMSKNNHKTAESEMLMGLAHDRIVELGMKYIERGTITRDEYENLYDYLYLPYKELGGNGSAERVMEVVKQLKITN